MFPFPSRIQPINKDQDLGHGLVELGRNRLVQVQLKEQFHQRGVFPNGHAGPFRLLDDPLGHLPTAVSCHSWGGPAAFGIFDCRGRLTGFAVRFPFHAARIVHDGSSRNCGVAKRDGRAEPREAEAYLKQYVDAARGEPARRHTVQPYAGLSQRRIRDCSRSVHE